MGATPRIPTCSTIPTDCGAKILFRMSAAQPRIFLCITGPLHVTYVPRANLFTDFSVGMYFANDKSLKNSPLSNKDRAPGLTLQQVFPLDELDRIPTMYFNYPYAGIVEQWYFHNDAFSIPFQSDTTWVHGRNMLRFGAVFTLEGKSELANPSSNNTNGSYTFLGTSTFLGAPAVNPLAEFLLGETSSYSETARSFWQIPLVQPGALYRRPDKVAQEPQPDRGSAV